MIDKIKTNFKLIVQIIVALVIGILYWQKRKGDSAESLLANQATKEKLLEIDRNISKNDGLLDAEEQKRREIEKRMNAPHDPTESELGDFFNKK